ncbi:hypothetical protein AN944_03309 [Shewanella sp. P1-14-1]|uniref:hypothetical protein n=1 Tax=Shewanella sp. P1-14-1 TaxID=1723761 RepID=UPI0006D68380|nr:hypothetical protein [Shewanella sp. P1-14-1]KPZ68897.1 hypothetical protein AN944_03309 [Shewanella sp. P1-14-1]
MAFERLKTKGLVFCTVFFFTTFNQQLIAATHAVMLTEVDETIVSISGNEEMEAIALLTEFSDEQLSFDQEQVSMTRGWLELSKQQNSCMFNKIKTKERESVAHFSKYPISVYPPLRLIVMSHHRELFPKEFDLANFPADTHGQLGVVKDRAYGDFIDEKIKRNPHQYYIRGGMGSSNSLIKMLKAERVKGIIEYSEVVDAFLRDNNQSLDYQSIPIRHVTQPIYGYIVCSQGEKGKKVIAEIDRIMGLQSFQEAFIQMHADFFGEAEQAILIPELERVFSQ